MDLLSLRSPVNFSGPAPPFMQSRSISNEPFPQTRRSVLERLNRGDDEGRRAAFDLLVVAYWQPIYAYLRLRWQLNAQDAQDLTQSFLMRAWQGAYFGAFDPARARFRTFLRVCVDRHTQNWLQSERAEKRGGGSITIPIDVAATERALTEERIAATDDVDALFHREFIRALFARSIKRLSDDMEARGREIVFRVFELYDVERTDDVGYAQVAERLGIPVTQVTNHLYAARRRFREFVLDELRRVSGSDEEFRSEARELFGVSLP